MQKSKHLPKNTEKPDINRDKNVLSERTFSTGNKYQWQDDWDLEEQGELNEVEDE